VRAALGVGAAVTGVPGPSAATLALAVSGLPADRFAFEGFLPRRGERRRARLRSLAGEERTLVVFCAPGRLVEDLADLAAALGASRGCAVCRELTKFHEEVWRGALGEAVDHWGGNPPRGEITLVVAGAPPAAPDLAEAVSRVEALVAAGDAVSAACRLVAEQYRVRRRALYEAVAARRRAEAG
jgi:16S rRNA (cytidine1402-2'-O)-methyltransferase